MQEYGPLSTLPLGLPNLFGQTGQQLPKAFSSLIQPTLDIMPFIAGANCLEQVVSFPATLTSTGQFDVFTLTSEEAWLVRGAYFTVGVLGAGSQALRASMYLGKRTAGSAYTDVVRKWDSNDQSLPVASDRTLLCSTDGWFLAYPGDRIGVMSELCVNPGAGYAGRCTAFIYRFSV